MRKLIILGLLLLTVVVAGPYVYNAFSLGNTLTDGEGDFLYYSEGVSKEQAGELFNILGKAGLYSGRDAKIQLSGGSEQYTLKIPLPDPAREDESVLLALSALGEYVSVTLFQGSPVEVMTCTSDLDDPTAVMSFQEIAKIRPVDAYKQICLVFEAADDLDNGIDYFKKCIKKLPENSVLLATLARAEARTGRYKTALKHCNLALKLQANSPDTLATLGYIKIGLKKPYEAKKAYDAAISASNDKPSAEAYLGLARAHEKLGEPIKAAKARKSARGIEPKSDLKWPKARDDEH